MPETQASYGEVAYLAYRAEYGWSDTEGTFGLHWSELTEPAKAGWEAAAKAAIDMYGLRNVPRGAPPQPSTSVPAPASTPSPSRSSSKADREDK